MNVCNPLLTQRERAAADARAYAAQSPAQRELARVEHARAKLSLANLLARANRVASFSLS